MRGGRIKVIVAWRRARRLGRLWRGHQLPPGDASKAFLLSFSGALRYELRDTGVTVTALMPGPTDTEFFDRAGMGGTKLREQTAKDDPAQVAREGVEALMAGKDHVVAGSAKNKAQVATGRVMPETAKAATQARQTQPGSGRPT